MIKEIDIDNEEEIIKECDFNYFYESEECSRELCMFYNDIIRQTTNENYNYREAIIDLGRIAITLNKQHKRIAELETKLAESEKKIEELKGERLKFYSDDVRRTQVINGVHFDIEQLFVFSEYVEHEKQVKADKDKEINELKQQLARLKGGKNDTSL